MKSSKAFDVKSWLISSVALILLITTVSSLICNWDILTNRVKVVQGEVKTQGKIIPLDINVALDTSGSGWECIRDQDLLENITSSFDRFSNQDHRILFNSFSLRGEHTTSSKYVEVSDKKSIQKTIDEFKDTLEGKNNYGDYSYTQMVIESLELSDKNAKKLGKKNVLILVTRSPAYFYKDTPEAIENMKKTLSEYNTSLYCIPLCHDDHDYTRCSVDILKMMTSSDNVCEPVNPTTIQDKIQKIVEKESFSESIKNESFFISKDNNMQGILELDIVAYFDRPASGYIQVAEKTNSGLISYEQLQEVRVSEPNIVSFHFSKEQLENLHDPYSFKWEINKGSYAGNIFYKLTYKGYSFPYADYDTKVRMTNLYFFTPLTLLLLCIAWLLFRLGYRYLTLKKILPIIQNTKISDESNHTKCAGIRVSIAYQNQYVNTIIAPIFDCHYVNKVQGSRGYSSGIYKLKDFFTNTDVYSILPNLAFCYNNGQLWYSQITPDGKNKEKFKKLNGKQKLKYTNDENCCIGIIEPLY